MGTNINSLVEQVCVVWAVERQGESEQEAAVLGW